MQAKEDYVECMKSYWDFVLKSDDAGQITNDVLRVTLGQVIRDKKFVESTDQLVSLFKVISSNKIAMIFREDIDLAVRVAEYLGQRQFFERTFSTEIVDVIVLSVIDYLRDEVTSRYKEQLYRFSYMGSCFLYKNLKRDRVSTKILYGDHLEIDSLTDGYTHYSGKFDDYDPVGFISLLVDGALKKIAVDSIVDIKYVEEVEL